MKLERIGSVEYVMNDDIDLNLCDDGAIVCSECGRDVRVARRIGVSRWGWAWVLPKAITGLAILSVLVLSLPGVRNAMGVGWASSSYTSSSITAGMVTPDPAVSLSDVRSMIDRGVEDRARVIGLIDEKIAGLEGHLWEGRVRFVAAEPAGMAWDVRDYGLLVSGFRSNALSYLLDVRDRESWDIERATSVLPGSSYWPYGYLKQISEHEHAYTKSLWFDYIDVVAVVASIWLMVWVIGLILARFGVEVFRRRGMIALMVVGLCIVYSVAMAMLPTNTKYLAVVGKVVQTSGWIEYETFMDELEASRSGAMNGEQLWAALAALSDNDPDSDMVLGMQFDYGHDLHTDAWLMQVGSLVEICSGSMTRMSAADDSGNEYVVQSPDVLGRGLDLQWSNRRHVVVSWIDDEWIWSAQFELMGVLMLVAWIVWLWKLGHWVVRVWIRRVDRRRVSRDQCIFCVYPLSDEGKKARSLGIGS